MAKASFPNKPRSLLQVEEKHYQELDFDNTFLSDEEFADKLVTLRTSYFSAPVISADSSALNEEVIVEEDKKPTVSSDPTVAAIASALSKTSVK